MSSPHSAEPPRCPRCQAPLPANAPQGLCPKCLLQAGFPSHPAAAHFTPPEPSALTELFPDLEIEALLGKGGMGAVYRARQQRLDRHVAVKILPPEVSQDPAFAARFTREARTLAKLNHPHIVQVYDFGQAGPYFYFVMEYVEGSHLRQALRAGGVSPAEALTIVRAICDALQFAHDAGVVHRDIKPENILIDRHGRVKIADFGLAMLLDHDPTDEALTETHQVMGTLHYMAPEQMRGSTRIDHRADIYSLGVVFYELLTGELPIGQFQAPSHKLQLDVRLDQVVLRALAAEPDRRYQHASDVQHDVETISISGSPATDGRVPALASGSASAHEATGTKSLLLPIVLLVIGNGWLLAAAVLMLGRNVARTQPLRYSFFDLGGWFTPGGYHLIVAGCAGLGLGCLLLAWWRHHQVAATSTASLSSSSLATASAAQRSAVSPSSSGSASGARGPQRSTASTPRWSRAAFVGACWAPFFFAMLVAMLTVSTVQNVSTTRIETPNEFDVPTEGIVLDASDVPAAPPPPVTRTARASFLTWTLSLLSLPLGLTAPFGTTALGLIAISQIRRSQGRLVGLPLAVADALFFPLFLLDGLLVAAFAAISWLLVPNGINVAFLLGLSLILIVVIDALIVGLVWKAVARPVAPLTSPVAAEASRNS